MITPAQIIDRIDEHTLATEDQSPREWLGASEIGDPCLRKSWYSFHWCAKDQFPARMLRLFARGDREEVLFIQHLRGAGFTVEASSEYPKDQREQFQFSDLNGHFRGTSDGVLLQPPEFDPEQSTWILGEFKTWKVETPEAPSPAYNALVRRGVKEAAPKHWHQMQTYMGYLKLEWALYLAECKNDDRIYPEFVSFDSDAFTTNVSKAEIIINSSTPPERVSNNPKSYYCAYCKFKSICYENTPINITDRHCRNCKSGHPAEGGTWNCAAGRAFGTLCENYQSVCGS